MQLTIIFSTSSNCVFYLTNSPKTKDIQFHITNDKAKKEIPIIEKLVTENICHFVLKNYLS